MATTLTSVVWVIGLVLAVVVVTGVVVFVTRRRIRNLTPTSTPSAAPAVDTADETAMTGLEAALAQVTGRDGRPIAEHIDAESQHVDDLRVPDDTGPLLRRALDHVEQHESPAGDASTDTSTGTSTDDTD